MGYKYHTWQEVKRLGDPGWSKFPTSNVKISKEYLCRTTKDMKYHSSWDWLIPVVGKIRDVATFKDDRCIELFTTISKYLLMIQIKDVYKYCVEFIKWYNDNKKP